MDIFPSSLDCSPGVFFPAHPERVPMSMSTDKISAVRRVVFFFILVLLWKWWFPYVTSSFCRQKDRLKKRHACDNSMPLWSFLQLATILLFRSYSFASYFFKYFALLYSIKMQNNDYFLSYHTPHTDSNNYFDECTFLYWTTRLIFISHFAPYDNPF